MGWWKVQGTQDVIGDGALDLLGRAVSEILDEYLVAFGRRPTCGEWEALLVAVLGADDEDCRPLDGKVVVDVSLILSGGPEEPARVKEPEKEPD